MTFARQFALMHPGFLVVAAVAAGAAFWLYQRDAAAKAKARVGTVDDPNYAWAPGAQAKFDALYNGLLGADTNWRIVDDRIAINGQGAFDPWIPATQSGILTPFTPFEDS